MKASDRPTGWIYPPVSDARWFQAGFLLLFDAYALSSPGFSRDPQRFLLGIGTCLALDFSLAYFYRGLKLLPISGFITSMGLLLLCDSQFLWVYPVVGALSILSKQFIRLQDRHIFNPLNFGVVVALLFLSDYVTLAPGRWGGSLLGLAAVAAFGALTVHRAQRLDLAAAYVLTFLAGAWVRHALSGAPLAVTTAPMTGAAFQLFTFFMITDPRTTPEKPAQRWLYGVILGVWDAVLRHQQVRNGPLYALFLLSGFLPLFWIDPVKGPPARRAAAA